MGPVDTPGSQDPYLYHRIKKHLKLSLQLIHMQGTEEKIDMPHFQSV